MKKFIAVLSIVSVLLMASIPVSANLSRSSYGGDNVGMYGNYNWDLFVSTSGSHSAGYYMAGSGYVHCYFSTSQGITQTTAYYSNSLYDYFNNPWVYSSNVDFIDA